MEKRTETPSEMGSHSEKIKSVREKRRERENQGRISVITLSFLLFLCATPINMTPEERSSVLCIIFTDSSTLFDFATTYIGMQTDTGGLSSTPIILVLWNKNKLSAHA